MWTTWGWATWQRAWEAFDWAAEGAEHLLAQDRWARRFNFDGTDRFSKMLRERLRGQNDSWGILWRYEVAKRNGIALYPRTSLVWNIGFDGSGMHCDRNAGRRQPARRALTWGWGKPPVRLPVSVRVDPNVQDRVFRFMARVAGEDTRNPMR